MKIFYKPTIKIVNGLYTVDPDDVKDRLFNAGNWYKALVWCNKMNRKVSLQKEINEYIHGDTIYRYY